MVLEGPKLILSLIATIVLAVLLVVATQTVLGWRDAAQANEQKEQHMKATSGILDDAAKSQAERTSTEATVTDARVEYDSKREEVYRVEPTARDWASQPVPRGLRDAARARRLARERSASVGADDRAGRGTEAAPQR
jgi:hypothetical protein